jgi:hypothetical protein
MISMRRMIPVGSVSIALFFGVTARASPTHSPSATPAIQGEMDREKSTLKDRGQAQVDAADANIGALQEMRSNGPRPTRKQADEISNRLSSARDRLGRDLGRIDGGNDSDWRAVRSVVEQEMMMLNTELKRASLVTNIPVPPYELP